MRVLLLLRGSAGCGKSTWIEQNGLEPYTLSADEIRLMYASPTLNVCGEECISQSNDTKVWKTLFQILESRMERGEFTVIDATNSKTSEMKRYAELCNRYRYRIYCVDFTDIPIEETKRRNKMRPIVKQVPETVIDNMYARFATQKIPSGITVIKPDELSRVWFKPMDVSEYDAVHFVGDVHGCYTALKEAIGDVTEKPNELFVFCGDYTDRGIENAEVVKELLRIYKEPNVYLIEGNHEKHMWVWANDETTGSKEFEMHTRAQLENASFTKKDVRKLYRSFGQCAYYIYRGKTILATHGGLSTLPNNLTLVATDQMIKGSGNYSDADVVDQSFCENTDAYQVHGHRNLKGNPIQTCRAFNLEGNVEFGGSIRVVSFVGNEIKVSEFKNNIYLPTEERIDYTAKIKKNESVADAILALRGNKQVVEKQFGDISSFNFSKQAFFDKIWDEQTIRARGLYINIPKGKIVARGYTKFFNVNERPETKFDMLQHKLKFPVTAYVKENGFLGLVSYNEIDDSLFVTTKSNPDGNYASWLKEMIDKKIPVDTQQKIKEFSRENNVTFVFECIDMQRDPHIIDYPENHLFLLDIIYNELKFKKFSYDKLISVADKFGLEHKERAVVINDWQTFFDWYYTVTAPDYLYNNRHIEGFVVEDAGGYMVKLKLAYYNLWKYLRGVSYKVLRRGHLDGKETSSLTTPLMNQYYAWLKRIYAETEDKESIPRDICSLRKLFYASDEGRNFTKEGNDND